MVFGIEAYHEIYTKKACKPPPCRVYPVININLHLNSIEIIVIIVLNSC